MPTMSVSGVASGMDWDSMIDEIITNAAKPAQVQVSKRTNLTNKKSLFEEMKVTMNSLQSSLTPLKLPSTYKAKQVDIERIDTNGSYKGVLTATVNADAEVNVYDLVVNKLARAQTNRSKQITASSVGSALSDQGLNKGTMYINMMGQKVGIDISSTDSLQTIKSKINNTVKTLDIPIGVTAAVVDNRLIIRSDNTGLGSNSLTETLTYNLNNKNTITSFNVSDTDLKNENFVIRSSNGTKLTYGKDYDVVNGNEIRWNPYEETDNVKLGNSVTATYKIGKGDIYESSGTYGTSEASITGLKVKDNDDFSSQFIKIVYENDITYTYGKDFTLDDAGKVVWLSQKEEYTEPSSYNVSYTKTYTVSSSISGTKGTSTTTSTNEPDSYIVRYDDKATGTYSVSSEDSGTTKQIDLDYDELNTYYANNNSGDELPIATFEVNGRDIQYLDLKDSSNFKMMINGTEYKYGRDYVIAYDTNPNARSWAMYWTQYDIFNTYRSKRGITDSPVAPETGKATFSYDYSYDYTRMGRVNASDNDKLLTTVLGSDFDMSNFDSSKLKIRGYEYGTDFTVNATDPTRDDYGEIKWIENTAAEPSRDDALTNAQFTSLQNAYNKVYGTTEIPTVTLTDADGVLRTYLDPEDASAFKMTSGNTEYEYGKDYVIRVNDDRNGYTISWAITDDANSDNTIDINDASTVVTTYTKYKDLTTYGMLQSPANGINYNFIFEGEVTSQMKGDVKSSQTDKSLSYVFQPNGESLRSSEYSSVVISDGSKTYTEGKDYVINSSGVIQWLDQNSTETTAYRAVYKFSDNASASVSVPDLDSDGIGTISGFLSIDDTGVNKFTDSTYTYIDEAEGKAAFTLTDSSGNTYEYGKDYAIRYSTDKIGDKLLTVVSAKEGYNWPTSLTNRDSSTSMPKTGLTITYNNTAERIINSSATIEDALGFIPSNWSKLTLTDADGNPYTDNIDYTINNSTGAITWLNSSDEPKHPESGVEYKLIYDAYRSGGINSSLDYDDQNTQLAVITVDSGKGNIDGTQLSYEQILSDTGLKSTSTDSEFAEYFSLVDEDGYEYVYGTDYRIIEGEEDTDSEEHSPLIEWLSPLPATGTRLTFTYTGRSENTIDVSVKRSNTDAIQTGTSGTAPLYSYFDGGTSTISQGSKTFYEGIDYEITKGDNGNAFVEWKTGTNSEWYFPPSNANYTINLTTSNGNSLSFSGVRDSSDTIDLRDYGFTSVNGSITSVSYQGKSTHTYDLTSKATDDDTDTDTDTDDTETANNKDTDTDKMNKEIGLAVQNSTNGGFRTFNFNWVTPQRTANADLPSVNDEFKAEFTYDANTFTLSDDSDGKLLAALELDLTDSEHYMAAQNAELVLDGETITRDSNDIGEAYDNELIKGMTIHLKGTGEVSLDVSHDAEKAVESIQTFVDTYNDLMTWMNTRMTESQVDKDTAATIDSDDFRMRWGLLHGNSLLRNTKSKMRSIATQNFTFSFTQRTSAEEIYGNMSFNGLRNDATLRLRIANKFVDVSILPTDTLQDIVNKINDDSEDGPMHDIYYDDEGKKLQQPLLKASIENDRLVINSTSNDSITMSGTSAMNALKLNYTYRGLYQLGISTTSTDYGKSGELEFDTSKFMEALEDNADEVQELMLMFANEFDSWAKSMLTSSATGETSGTLTREIENLDNQIKTIDEYLEKYQERLDRQEESLRTRYGNTETQFARLSQQASSIAAILNQLNGYTNNNSSSSS